MHILNLGFGLSVILYATAAIAGAPEELTSACKVFSTKPYSPATVGIAIQDAASGEELFAQNGSTALLPASSMKAITTAAAMRYLGPDTRFATKLYATGQLDSGKLSGDLLIMGGGDPTFGSDRVPSSQTSATVLSKWVETLRAVGIRRVDGAVVFDDTYFGNSTLPGGYEWEDIGNYYAAGVSGLNFRDNFFNLVLKPDASIGEPVEIVGTEPVLPFQVTWKNDLRTSATGTGDQATVYSAPGSLLYHVAGTIPIGKVMNVKATMHEPGAVLAAQLRDQLTSAGISVSGEFRRGSGSGDQQTSRLLAQVDSPTVEEIVTITNMQSFNLYAETLQMQIGKVAADNTREGAIGAELRYLRELGVPLDGFHIRDGSGLSRGSTVTAGGMATLCQKLQREPWFKRWEASLPVMGTSGDLRDRAKESVIKGRVRGKTGLITRVRGLCGYLDAKSGRKLTFAVHVNGYENSWTQVDADIDKVLEVVYETY